MRGCMFFSAAGGSKHSEDVLAPGAGRADGEADETGPHPTRPSLTELLRDLGVTLSPGGSHNPTRDLEDSADEEALLRALRQGPRPADLVARESGLPTKRFVTALFNLTERGRLRAMPGDLLAIVRADR